MRKYANPVTGLSAFGGLMLLLMCSPIGAAESLRLISGAGAVSLTGSGGSFVPSFSGDGRYVVFLSHAQNLVTNLDQSGNVNVFVRDLAGGQTRLVSVSATGNGGADRDAGYPSISSNGQWVAFASASGNLVPDDNNNASDVFVRDLISGVTTLVSVNQSGVSPEEPSVGSATPLSSNPQISADGQWVVFESVATNLVDLPDTNGAVDIFARNLRLDRSELVSRNAAGTSSASGRSDSPVITPDAARVAFISTAIDLVSGGPTNGLGDVYVRDLRNAGNGMFWASRLAAQVFADSTNGYRCFYPVISGDGRYVVFKAAVPGAAVACVIDHDLVADRSTLLASNAPVFSAPQISADGRWVAFDDATNVYVWDRMAGSNILVNVAYDQRPSPGSSHTPVMSLDGRSVAFFSSATNLVPNVTDATGQIYLRSLTSGTTRLISVNLQGQPSSRSHEGAAFSVSGDGTRVAFESLDDELVSGDRNAASDVFLWDWNTGTDLVSVRDGARPEATGVGLPQLGLFYITSPAWQAPSARSSRISSNGEYLVFTSYDRGPAFNDTNRWPDVYVANLVTGALTPVSTEIATQGVSLTSGFEPVISANGRYVVFGNESHGPGSYYPTAARFSVVRKDLQTGQIDVVVTNLPLTQKFIYSRYDQLSLSISADGRYVVYSDGADIFLKDCLSGTNEKLNYIDPIYGFPYYYDHNYYPLLSPNAQWIVFVRDYDRGWGLYAREFGSGNTWQLNDGVIGNATFSADSRYVAYMLHSVWGSIYVYDLQSKTKSFVCTNCQRPSLSGNGRWAVYETFGPMGAEPSQIRLKDLQTGSGRLVSVNRSGGAGGNGDSKAPQISADGRYVVFVSRASDLVANDLNAASDVFVRDLVQGTTLLISRNLQGTGSGNRLSSNPVMGQDGRTVLFQSFASDLVPADYNDSADLFVLRLGTGDTDNDGLPDDWEVGYFGNLSRDGTGDADGDGQTDLQEYLAATDPTNHGSVLQVLRLTAFPAGSTTVLWSAVPGKAYQAQYKDSLSDPGWTDLGGVVVASDATASTADPAPGGQQRFYRVVLVP